jgi:hypothetical protein
MPIRPRIVRALSSFGRISFFQLISNRDQLGIAEKKDLLETQPGHQIQPCWAGSLP